MNQDNMAGGVTATPSSPPQATEIKQELASDAKDIGKVARDRLDDKATEGKEQATQAARSTSSALTKAADELRQDEGTPSWLATAFEKSAEQIERLAGSLEGKDTKAIQRDVTDFARRSPMAFLAASAVAGFAAARVLRAGSDHQEHSASGGAQGAGRTGSSTGAQSGFAGASSEPSSFTWANEDARPGGTVEGMTR